MQTKAREKFLLILLSGLAYFLMDAPVQMTGILPSFAGIKNFLPSTLGLFFGIWGVTGCMLGCAISACLVNPSLSAVLYECYCIAVTGLGMFWGWHFSVKYHRPSFKRGEDYLRYIVILALTSALCLRLPITAAYFLTGLFIGIPVNILFSSLLYIEPVIPERFMYFPDAEFCIMPGIDSLEGANEMLEEAAVNRNISTKRILELQSCIEELSIRILKVQPEARISVSVLFGEAISARLHYAGEKYNPFHIEKDEDEIDIMSLAIIKHRAIRASFTYSGGINSVHAVV